jgi:hypothetical protein
LILSRHLPFDKFPDLRFDFPQVTRDLAVEILIYLYDLLLDLGDFPQKLTAQDVSFSVKVRTGRRRSRASAVTLNRLCGIEQPQISARRARCLFLDGKLAVPLVTPISRLIAKPSEYSSNSPRPKRDQESP